MHLIDRLRKTIHKISLPKHDIFAEFMIDSEDGEIVVYVKQKADSASSGGNPLDGVVEKFVDRHEQEKYMLTLWTLVEPQQHIYPTLGAALVGIVRAFRGSVDHS